MSNTKRSFKIKNIQSSNVNNSITTDKINNLVSNDTIIYKGGEENKNVIFNLEIFEEIVKELELQNHTLIKDLTPALHEKFKSIVAWINAIRDDVKSYKLLYAIVQKVFANCKSPVPGTVGGYFAGCMVPTSFTKDNTENPVPGCSVVCAGSMPKPKDDSTWTFCSHPVINATFQNNKYSFTILNRTENMEKALIFLNLLDIADFSGFSVQEKEKLLENGVKEIKLLGFSSNDGTNYKDLLGGAVRVEDIKTRVNTGNKSLPSSTKGNSSHTITITEKNSIVGIVLTLFFIIFIILVVWYLWKKNKKIIN